MRGFILQVRDRLRNEPCTLCCRKGSGRRAAYGSFFLCPACAKDFATKGPKAEPEAYKDDDGKPRYELLPWLALAQVQDVLDYGAKKYSAHGWRAVQGRTRYLNAALRHIFAYARGENNDPESGLPHLAHAACCVLFQLEKDDPDFAATEALRKARIARLGED